MKTLTVAISILMLASGTASADMTVKPSPSWTGFYIGAHGGYGWNDDPFSSTIQTLDGPLIVSGFKSHGWIGGGHFGHNWQYGAVVGGLELDVSATGIRGNSDTVAGAVRPAGPIIGPPILFSSSFGNDVKLLASARGRLGWTPNSDWLLYGTGGFAWEKSDQLSRLDQSNFVSAANISSTPVSFLGWVLGAGVEARLASTNWIARLEYLHYDFGHTRITTGFTAVGAINVRIDDVGNQAIDIVRAGLSYKFGSGL